MFQIKQKQIAALDRVARTNFYQRLAIYLREVMPEETSHHDDEALIKYIATSDGRASTHGIETEAGIAQWTCLALIQGLEFDEDPAMREYLKAPGMAAEAKLEALVNGLNEALLDLPEPQG